MARKKIEDMGLEEEKLQKIKELKEEINHILYDGSFRQAYRELRKETVEIAKADITESEKKQHLVKLLDKIKADINN